MRLGMENLPVTSRLISSYSSAVPTLTLESKHSLGAGTSSIGSFWLWGASNPATLVPTLARKKWHQAMWLSLGTIVTDPKAT